MNAAPIEADPTNALMPSSDPLPIIPTISLSLMQRLTQLVASLLLILLTYGCGGGGGGARFRLAFGSVPTSGTNTRTLSTVTVRFENGSGTLDTSATGTVTISLADGVTGVALAGTLSAAATAGVATFNGIAVTGTSSSVRLRATAPSASNATSSAFPVLADATQLVITSAVPSSIAPMQGFDVTVELRTAGGGVATQLTDAVTLAVDSLPDLLWHASGNSTRVTELVEVTTAPAVIGTLANPISGEIFGATWVDSLDAVVVTDISNRIGLANATTGDEVRYSNGSTLSQEMRTIAFDAAGAVHAGSASDINNYQIDPLSGVDTVIGQWAFSPATLTPAKILGFATQPGTGTVFAIVQTTVGTSDRRLATVDLLNSTLTDIGAFGDRFSSLSFTPAGVLYGVTGNGATVPETLFTIDTATGTPTLSGALGNGADGEVIAVLPRRVRGTTTVNAVAGVATFTNVWFENIGTDCTLAASTTALTSASSSTVQVTGAVTPGADVQFDTTTSSVAENVAGGTIDVTISLSAAVTYALPVMIDVTGTATIGGSTPDATIAGAFQLMFAPGETTKTITIPIIDDTVAESDETIVLTIRSARLATSIGANNTHTITITSDE